MALSNGLRIALAGGAGAAVFAGIVAVVPRQEVPDVAPVAQEAAAEVAAPAADVAAEPVAEPETEAVSEAPAVEDAVPEVPAVEVPRLETVRIEPDGMSVIAGRAAAGATVAILLGEEVLTEVVADDGGAFVGLVSFTPSDQPRVLSLVADPAGAAVPSDETYLVAPVVASAAEVTAAEVAAADGAVTEAPEAEPEASAEAVAEVVAAEEAPETEVAVADVAVTEAPAAEVAVAEVAAADVAVTEAPAVEPDALAEAVAEVVAAEEAPETEVAKSAPAEVEPVAEPETVADAFAAAEVPAADTVAEAEPVPEPEVEAPAVDAVAASESVTEAAEPVPEAVADAAPVVVEREEAEAPLEPEVAVAGDAAPAEEPVPEAVAETPVPDEPEPEPPEAVVLVPELDEPMVNEAAVAPVLVSDQEGVRVLQPALAPGATPEVLRTVALDSISYDDQGEVLLDGRATGGGVVRIYVNNAPVAEAVVNADGQWSSDLTDVVPGVYQLRVDQVDETGKVLSRIETPFQRENREAIASALAEQTQNASFGVAAITVQPGNTLWAIARDRYGEGVLYVSVFEANRDRIRDADLIYPGQVFVLPAMQFEPPAEE
ncbi:MAG: LysM peptidoglycan-binding domain-containing protein [Rhodobacterales bacterium]|nr:LysM peptidoglycan-binding domain-containing protein [Rhodobacterales bacterium]